MFKRVIIENWQTILPNIGFALTVIVFVYFVYRAVRMKPTEVDRISNLPLENENKDK